MSHDTAPSPQEILDAFQKATTTFNLCPNRVWAVAREDLPRLIQAAKAIRVLDDHKQCTIDFCEHSQRDFTAVEQRHECRKGVTRRQHCRTHVFSTSTLNSAALRGSSSTVWALDGIRILAAHRPYMAISHVWSDGTGAGSWPAGQVNICLYAFFRGIAEQLGCEGMWWDTISIPRSKAARARAIRRIQKSYQDAKMTLVHDSFLRSSRWVDAEAACFAILMSPWFSRGWTALELANSRKVKVLFKGRHGFLTKDLDEEILAKDENASEAHKRATNLIKSLRRGVTTLDDLLVVLGARCTSWPKDMAMISGLLVGVDISPQGQSRDVLQQDVYKRILTKIGRLAAGHLFHNSATIGKGSSWCPINLFSMPISGQNPTLMVDDNLDVIGKWDIIPVDEPLEENCIWNGTHLMLQMQLKLALQNVDKCVLLTECATQTVDRALLVKVMHRKGTEKLPCFQYIGALHFHPTLPKTRHIKLEVRILGDSNSHTVNDRANAWEYVKKMAGVDKSRLKEERKKATIRSGDKAVMALWPTGNRPVHEPGTGRTALHYAILKEDHVSFRRLVKISNIEMQDALKKLPFHLAAERGHANTLQQLLDELSSKYEDDIGRRKAILDTQCVRGQTTLHCAAFACSETIVDKLLKAGANPNLTDNNKNTPLHIAVASACEPVVARLLAARANPNIADNNGSTALHMAVKNGSAPIIARLLTAKADPNLMDNSKNTPLHVAIRYRFQPAITRLLADPRCDVNTAKPSGSTALYSAVELGNESLVRQLVESGADVNKVSGRKKEVPLRKAIASGCRPLIEFLISSGADVDARDADRVSLLHVAVEQGDKATMLLLLRKGACVDARDKAKLTPLHYAARKGRKSLVELLVSNGARVTARGYRGSTPLDFAKRMRYDKIVDILR